jgi:hypothetical protein
LSLFFDLKALSLLVVRNGKQETQKNTAGFVLAATGPP